MISLPDCAQPFPFLSGTHTQTHTHTLLVSSRWRSLKEIQSIQTLGNERENVIVPFLFTSTDLVAIRDSSLTPLFEFKLKQELVTIRRRPSLSLSPQLMLLLLLYCCFLLLMLLPLESTQLNSNLWIVTRLAPATRTSLAHSLPPPHPRWRRSRWWRRRLIHRTLCRRRDVSIFEPFMVLAPSALLATTLPVCRPAGTIITEWTVTQRNSLPTSIGWLILSNKKEGIKSYLNAVVAGDDTSILHLDVSWRMGEFAFGIGSRTFGALELAANIQLEPAWIFGINHIIKINIDNCHAVAVVLLLLLMAAEADATSTAAAVAGRWPRRRMVMAVDHHHRSSSATDDGIHFFLSNWLCLVPHQRLRRLPFWL